MVCCRLSTHHPKHLGPGVFRYKGFQIWEVCTDFTAGTIWNAYCSRIQRPGVQGFGILSLYPLCFGNHVWANLWVTTSVSSYMNSVKFWLLVSILIVFNHSIIVGACLPGPKHPWVGLNENSPINRFVYVNAWSPISGTTWECDQPH